MESMIKYKTEQLLSQVKMNTEDTNYRMHFYHWATNSLCQEQTEALMTSGAAFWILWPVFVLSFKWSCKLWLTLRKEISKLTEMPFNLMDNLIETFHKVYEQEACEQKQISGFCFIVKLNWNKIQKSGGVHRLMRREGKCLLQQSKIVTVIYFYRLKKFCGMLKKSYSQSCVHKWSFSWCPALNGTLAP